RGRPWWVRIADAPMLTGAPVHDHRSGRCTLPDAVTARSASVSWRTSGCYWRATDYYVFGDGVSGGREWSYLRREARRRRRRRARLGLRACPGED
ncbi:MAG TPA: hypothetical protein VGD91_03450, partial [Trebonia sp.]